MTRDPERFGAYVDLASAYLQKNDVVRARAAIDRAIALNPSLGRAYETKGLILWRAGDDRGARDMFRAAVGHDPRMVRAMVWQGMVEMNLTNAAGALESFTNVPRTWTRPASMRGWASPMPR